jgi:hypothetical protein
LLQNTSPWFYFFNFHRFNFHLEMYSTLNSSELAVKFNFFA